ncbi:hypothetical protein Bbelb_014630 [Branchiostoma belcheri]|nr:hypothetical protein Bbelb_014630 [Branchiostoma belcheri]
MSPTLHFHPRSITPLSHLSSSGSRLAVSRTSYGSVPRAEKTCKPPPGRKNEIFHASISGGLRADPTADALVTGPRSHDRYHPARLTTRNPRGRRGGFRRYALRNTLFRDRNLPRQPAAMRGQA